MAGRRGVTVVDPGLLTLVQDLGRPGLGDLGVVASGAADRDAARQANRLVGNGSREAVLETVLGGLTLTAHGHQVMAWPAPRPAGRSPRPTAPRAGCSPARRSSCWTARP